MKINKIYKYAVVPILIPLVLFGMLIRVIIELLMFDFDIDEFMDDLDISFSNLVKWVYED